MKSLLFFIFNLMLCITLVKAKPPAKVKMYIDRAENTKKREMVILPYLFRRGINYQ